MTERIQVTKTHKLFINGAFPRSESGRSAVVIDAKGKVAAHLCRASRKDVRDAVTAAAKAQPSWAERAAYNRSQILYRMGEMLEGKSDEFIQVIKQTTNADLRAARKQVAASIDRLVAFAGWADKFSQVLGCHNPIAGPYYNFTVPEATGVVAVIGPDEPSLLGLISLIAPALCAGNTIVALASRAEPITACLLGEVCATSDVPGGVINILTGDRAELIDWIAGHREVGAIHAGGLNDDETRSVRLGCADNMKRITLRDLDADDWYDDAACESPWWIEPFVEMKTIWHPSSA